MQALARELQSMASRLDKMTVSSRSTRRARNRKPKANNLGASVSAVQPSLTVNQNGGRRRRKNKRGNASRLNVSTGDVIITKMELIKTVKLEANKSTTSNHIDLIPDTFPWLKNFFNSFDRLRFEACKFYWKPLVGTTYGGAISMGMDWDWAATDGDRSKISGFSPNISLPVYADGENRPLVLPKNRLQSRLWYTPRQGEYTDKGPGKVIYCVDGKSDKAEQTIGDIWVKYTVTLSGTNPS